MSDFVFDFQDIYCIYVIEVGQLDVFKGVLFSLQLGEIVGLIGLFGFGKFLLFYVVGLFECFDGGDVIIGGVVICDLFDCECMVLCCSEVGFVY